jgi:serine phosphatase RsbU (regulator of sigma subunit)
MRWFSVSKGGLPHNYINSLFADDEGKLWVSTNSSILACISGDKITRIPITTGSGILTLGPITQDRESRIWVGSKGNGIFIIGTDSIFYLSTRENLFSDYCYSIICDDNNYIWVGHRGGLSRIRTTDLSVKPVRSINVLPGEYHLNPNAIAIDDKQNIWIGSDRGLISYNQSMEIADLEPPVLSITALWINDEEREFSENRVVLSPGKYKIRIEYLGVSLKEPHLVTYQHKLEGYDQWSDISKSTSVTFSQLDDGDYRFILKAASGEGIVTPNPLVFQLIIKKPLWKKWWFYAVSLLILGLIITWIIERHFQRLKNEKRILEEKIQERTREIKIQRDEIEKQHNIIEERNNNITSSIRYASTIQNAVLTPREYIDTLLPENFILSIPRDIVSGDFYWVTEKNEKIVIIIGDCTGHGVPGAFMSMLGITLLNEIVNTQGITRPDEIVTMLRELMIRSLKQNRIDTTTTDGIDMAVCVIHRQSGLLQYTGAFNDLVMVSNGKTSVLKADRISVSASIHDTGKYTLNELRYSSGDMIYLFSDGYMDQFGGDFAKKFLRAHFYTTLLEVSVLPVSKQSKFLMEKLQGWMQDHGQTDDITVMGIRL